MNIEQKMVARRARFALKRLAWQKKLEMKKLQAGIKLRVAVEKKSGKRKLKKREIQSTPVVVEGMEKKEPILGGEVVEEKRLEDLNVKKEETKGVEGVSDPEFEAIVLLAKATLEKLTDFGKKKGFLKD